MMEKKWIKDGKFVALSTEQLKELSTEELSQYSIAKQEDLLKSFEVKFEQMNKDFLKDSDIAKIKEDFMASIKGLPLEDLQKYTDTIDQLNKGMKTAQEAAEEIKDIALKQGAEIKALKERSSKKIPDIRRKASRKQLLKETIVRGLLSKEFSDFQSRGYKGATNKMFLDQNKEGDIELKETSEKAVVPISDHTGTVMISEISDIVTDDTPTRMEHVRDIINVGLTNQAQIVAGQVYDWTDSLTLGAVMLAENQEAPESVFKSKENTWTLKRIANSMRISKRWFKTNGLQWVIDKVLSKLPDATLYVEDVQLLFGDGAGNNVEGLYTKARPFSLTPETYVAGNFASVASYNNGAQALITFNVEHKMHNGSNLTIANATEASYNATHLSVEIQNATQVVIDLAYVAEADTSAWTGSSQSPFYQAIELAQEYDVLAVADATLEAGEYACTGHAIHPSQATQMGLLKDTQGNYLDIAKDDTGRVVGVNGKPIVQTTAVPYGKFFSGDWSRNGLELLEYTPLNIQFVEDVETVKKNEIVVVIEEEIIFPVYNPFWFFFGKFSTAKTQLETP